MRFVQLSAGTGSFHCGTCMRDNALVRELCRRGHDALLAPLYLPLVLDEPAAPGGPLFYGGVNVYLQQKSALFRRTPRAVDRLLDSPGLLQMAARRSGMTDARELGALTLSTLRGEEGRQVKELDRLAEWLAREAKPDVVCIPNALLLGLARRIKEATGATVACFLQGEESFLDGLPEPERAEAWKLVAQRAADADVLLPVSRYHAGVMAERAGIPEERMRVVWPGIALEDYADPPRPPAEPAVGFLSRLCRSKGVETLVEAFLLLAPRFPRLRLRLAGSMTDDDEPLVSALTRRLEEAGWGDRVELHPNLDREQKVRFLRGCTLLSVPALYGESFGLYLLEAMAAGVPVVQPRHAAFPEVVEATGGGILCEPDSPDALAEAIAALLEDPGRCRALGEQGRRAVLESFHVGRMASEVLEAVRPRG